MKNKVLVASVSVLGLFAAVTAASAQSTTDTRSVSASVAGALQAPSGFLTGGQVQVTGVGQGAVVLTRNAANITLDAGATSDIVNGIMPESSSRMVTTFDFSRQVETGGALVGVGSVIAQGESLGGVGIVGASSADATRAGTSTFGGSPASGSSTTPTSAQGSLIGDFTTTNNMQLVGTGTLFAGAQTLEIGERTAGVSFGNTGAISADAEFIDLDGATVVFRALNSATPAVLVDVAPRVDFASGAGGAGFAQSSTLIGANGSTIDFNVSNAGSGTVAVSASTGGFFGEGTAFGATARPTFSEVNGFFNNGL
jgi:hypothetical protein